MPESREEIVSSFQQLREEARKAYRPFVEQGVTDPDRLDMADFAVESAHKLFYEWIEQGRVLESWDIDDLRHRVNLQRTMFYVDAGFSGRNYLDDVLRHLTQDSADIRDEKDNPARAKTRLQMRLSIARVRTLLKGSPAVRVDCDLSDIDLNRQIEEVPHFDLVEMLNDANDKAAEDPEYETSTDRPMLVWKYLPDEAKAIWNFQIWNRLLLTDPDAVEAWAQLRGRNVHNVPKVTKKIKIDRPT